MRYCSQSVELCWHNVVDWLHETQKNKRKKHRCFSAFYLVQVCVSKLRKSVRDLKSTWQHFENYDYASRKAIVCQLLAMMMMVTVPSFPLWSPLWSCTAIEIMGWLSDFLFLTEFWLRNPENKMCWHICKLVFFKEFMSIWRIRKTNH